MPKTNAEIAAFRDTNKTRAGWWDQGWELVDGDWVLLYSNYTGPDFATDDIACFKELEPPLLAMGFSIYKEKHAGTIIEYPTTSDPSFSGTYAAAVTAAFSWAMDNQPEALRRACEEVGRV